MGGLVTLTTDFGARDPYVAAIKGVLLDCCPRLQVVDLTHEIAPQDVLEGALFLAGALHYFPAGTVHLVVVDPGVGTERQAVAVAAGGQFIVCPDNGLLTLFLRRYVVDEARLISAPAFMRETVSPTFHGRDVFAPAAARLACGTALAEAGPRVDELVMIDIPECVREGDRVRGEVVHIDRFGNAISNIDRASVGDGLVHEVYVDNYAPALQLHRTYGSVPAGQALAVFGSADYLEVAVNRGSAAGTLGISVGDRVEVIVAGR